MSGSATATALDHLARPLRRLRLVAWATFAVGGSGLVLGLLAWSARLNWFAEPAWVLVAWSLAVVVVLSIAILAWRFRAGLSLRSLAQWLETRGGRLGSLTAHLDQVAPGTSADLFALADSRVAGELTRTGSDSVAPLRAVWQERARWASGLALVGVIALWSSGPTHGAPSLLWRPRAAWVATTAPLQLHLSSTDVTRGEKVVATIEALGRRQGILWLRAPGESWRGRGIRLDSLGQLRDTLGPLESDLFVRFTSGGRSSDTLQVRVRIPAFLGSLTLSARYPRYLSREDEPVPTDGDTIFVPAGTRLEAIGEATADLAQAEWQSSGVKSPLNISGSKFSGSFVPSGSRVYQLALVTTTGMPLVGDTVRIPVVTVADSAPHIEVPVPGVDTVAPLSLRVPLVMDVQDDHGVQKVIVESRRISRLGFADPTEQAVVPMPPGNQSRLILPFDLDLNQRGLLPGDTVRYLVRAFDNAPTPNGAKSREYVLRLPTLSEIRKATREATSAMAGALDSLAQASRKLERQTEDLAQEHPRQDADRPGSTDESLSFEAAKRTEAVAQSQEMLQKQVDEIKKSLESLQKSADAAGVNDPEFQRQLQEIQRQLDRALTPELREKLAELQKSLQDLDPERTQEALKDLAQAQEQLREALERSKELFRRAALEGDLANLTAESKELAQAQEQWNQQAMTADSQRAAAEERDLASRTDSLSKALSSVGEQLTPEGKQEAMQQAADQAAQAGQQMQQAAKSASQGQRKQAQQQGQQASQALKPLGDQLEKQKQDLQQEWKQEVTAALDRALSETSRLTERQLAVSEAFKQGDTSPAVRAEQAALEEGVERLLQQMKEASGKNAMVSQGTSVALSTARDGMRQAREALANAAPNPREAGSRSGDAVDALNTAAYQLIRSRGDVDNAGSGSGLAEAMQKMSEMAGQQGQMGQQAGGLLPMAGPGASGAVQEQIRRLGAQQRALAEQLERMRAGGNIPGSADMADEAKDLARKLEAGRLDRQTVERQERLFRRMLDAGRTLQGHEEDEQKERQSTTANNDSVRLPPALKSLLQGNDATLRMPSWEQLQNLSPDQRRLVVEYFRRLSEQTEKVSGEW